MLSRRELKKLAARWVPEALKSRMRGALYGYHEPAVRFDVRVERGEGGIATAAVDGRMRFRIPEVWLDDVLFHFQANGASVEEMHGFLRAARERRGTLFDVGAHRGLFSHVFCLADPRNRAVAYEPSPVLLEAALVVRQLNGIGERETLREAAVGAAPAEVPGWTDEGGFIQFGAAKPAEAEALAVEFTSLDAEVAELGVVPSIVKIDVEGFEGEVLQGARELLREHRPLLFLELHLDILEGRGASPRALVDGLSALGYAFETPLGKPLPPERVYDSPHAVLRVVAR